MPDKTFNILAVSKDQSLIHLLNGVLGSVDHQIRQLTRMEEMLPSLFDQAYQLLVIDLQGLTLNKKTMDELQRSFPEIPSIIIEQNAANLEEWAGFRSVHYIVRNQLEKRLPALLSTLYESFNEAHLSSLEYFDLLSKALEESPHFVAIVHVNGDIIFLNRLAREILKIQPDEVNELKFFDFLKEGEKVWQFLTMRWHNQEHSSVSIDLSFTDKHFNEFVLPVNIKTVKNTDIHFIILGRTASALTFEGFHADSKTLLKSFSESLANDLLNPLNVIWGRLQLFQADSKFKEAEQHHFELIEKQLSRINEVISKLKAFTSLDRDLVPQRVFLNDVFRNLLMQPTLQNILLTQNNEVKLKLEAMPPLFGQAAQIELLFTMLIDLIFKLTGTKSTITIRSESGKQSQNLKLHFEIEDITHVPDQVLLKTCLQFDQAEKKKFALESTIIRHLLNEYQVKHHLKEVNSTLILSLAFPLNKLGG